MLGVSLNNLSVSGNPMSPDVWCGFHHRRSYIIRNKGKFVRFTDIRAKH
jgi:hypothetical protein